MLSVLIPAFNEEAHVARVIASVRTAMNAVGEAGYEVIVCDNNSTDATADRGVEAGARVVFEAHNQIARARNTAARAATGEWFIFIDADSELSTELLKETLRQILENQAGAGGALVEFGREDLGWHVRLGLGFWNFVSRLMGWAAGSYIFCHRRAWEETGGFNEAWYAGEEILFSRELKRWCRKQKLRFAVITGPRLRTSARKIDNHTVWQMIRLLVGLALPGALKRQDRCGYWYRR